MLKVQMCTWTWKAKNSKPSLLPVYQACGINTVKYLCHPREISNQSRLFQMLDIVFSTFTLSQLDGAHCKKLNRRLRWNTLEMPLC